MSTKSFAALGFALALAGCAANNDSVQSAASYLAPSRIDRTICIVSSEASNSALEVMARHHLQNKGYIVKLDCSGAAACRQRLWINVSNSPLGVYQPKSISVEWRDGYTGEKRRASWKSGTTRPNSTLLTAGYSDDPQAVLYRLIDNLFVEASGHR